MKTYFSSSGISSPVRTLRETKDIGEPISEEEKYRRKYFGREEKIGEPIPKERSIGEPIQEEKHKTKQVAFITWSPHGEPGHYSNL